MFRGSIAYKSSSRDSVGSNREWLANPPHHLPNPRSVPSEIGRFAFWMSKQGYKESTIRSAVGALKALAKRTDLLKPEDVKEYLARAKLTDGRKETLRPTQQGSMSSCGYRFKSHATIEQIPCLSFQLKPRLTH